MFFRIYDGKRYRDFDVSIEDSFIRMKKLGCTDTAVYTKHDKGDAFMTFVKTVAGKIIYINIYSEGSIEKGAYCLGDAVEDAEPVPITKQELKEIDKIFKSIKWSMFEGYEYD